MDMDELDRPTNEGRHPIAYAFEPVREVGVLVPPTEPDYGGEIEFSMQYKQVKGESFPWLYIDFETLKYYASQYGFKTEMVKQGEHYDYLAKLSLI